ncbi:Phox homologous domain-containing protein [Pavlovales sp. CCMP2436]|nr:Phox homologous domain-containing protein [Pavlovales sp. CCMP2436]
MFEEELHGPPPLVQQHTSMVLSVEVVHIEIGDALSEGFGPRRFTSYRLTSTVRENVLNAFGGGELTLASGVTCRRRFNGFLKLRAELLEAWPGVIIPPLPEKQTVGRFDPEFVEKRRRALASFLGACATHPLLCACPLLHSFCEWPAALRSTVLQCAPTQYVPSAEEFNRTGSGEPLKSALNDIDAFALQAAKLRDVLKREHVRDLERSVDLMELAQAYGSFGTSDFNFALRPLLAKASQTMGVLSTLAKLQAEADQKALLNTLKE